MAKPRYYRLERNARKRLATVKAMYPDRKFWVSTAYDFRFVVATCGPTGRIAYCS